MSNAFAMSKAHGETVDKLLLKYSVADIKQEIALAQLELVLKLLLLLIFIIFFYFFIINRIICIAL